MPPGFPLFSPRPWGCVDTQQVLPGMPNVFPTPVGVCRYRDLQSAIEHRSFLTSVGFYPRA